jgi:putative transposase
VLLESTSMVGRILTQLRAQRRLVEPVRRAVSARKARPPRPYAMRKPREYAVRAPSDLVQIDTLDLRPRPGVTLKRFTGRDVISRWDVLMACSRATATTATDFLAVLEQRMPFVVPAIQVDGGSEFAAALEAACQGRGIRLSVLPPRSPQLTATIPAHRSDEAADPQLDVVAYSAH